MLNNQGYVKQEFRAGLGLVRLAESTMTAAAYLYAGMFTKASIALSLQILPSLALGVPLGALLISRVQPEVFRRICMSFDVWIVAFGLASVLRILGIVDGTTGGGLFAMLAAFDVWLLYLFFRQRRTAIDLPPPSAVLPVRLPHVTAE
jgi:hypothetical protein